MFFLELIKKTIDKNDYQRINALGELNDRIVMPLFIPSLIILGTFLIITNKEIINYNLLKLITFVLGTFLIVASEILLDLSSKHLIANYFLYLSPFFLLLVNWILLNYILEKENKK
jgi:lipopolysaccharide export LptBFGC system permease protein LptF